MKPDRPALALLLLFVSGFCSLVYQTLWVKQLGLVIGVDVYAVSIVVSGFFFGLGVGSFYFAGVAQRSANPRRLYAQLELATATASLLTLLLLWLGAPLYVAIEAYLGRIAIALLWLIIAIPAVFMGGTFLALLRYYRTDKRRLGQSVGVLYGANTSGAIIGTITTPFVLIPLMGVIGSGLFAVSVNLVLALLAAQLLLPKLVGSEVSAERSVGTQGRHIIFVLYSLVGFSAIAYEVIWGQMIIQFLNTRSHAYAVMLAVYLAGLAVGNLLMSRRVDAIKNTWQTFSLLILTAAASALFSIVLVNAEVLEIQRSVGALVYQWTGQLGFRMLAQFLFISFFFIFVPTCCFGALFPVAAKISDGNAKQGTLSSGYALATNTLGGVVASLLFGFWVIPALGLINAVVSVTVLLCTIACIALYHARCSRHVLPAFAASLLLIVSLAVSMPRDKFAQLLVNQEGGELQYFAEGVGNTVAVIQQGEGDREFRRLYIEGISNTGDVMASLRYMRLQSYIPLLVFNGQPRSALVIGMGTGITSGALLNYPALETLEVVELLPEVVAATPYFQGNYAVYDNADIGITVGDGRHKLLRDPQRFDLITLEPPPPTAAGVNNLYSSDFYQLCKTRLTPNGVVAQWWPISTQSLAASRSLVRAMLDSFDYVTLWTTELHEMLLVGSMHPMSVDIARIENIMHYPPLAESLREIGINSPEALLATYMMNKEGLEAFAGDAKPVTDNFPRLEYDSWTSKKVILDVLPELLSKQQELTAVPPARRKAYHFEQEKLHAFYLAGLSVYSGDRETWAEMLKRLYRADNQNAYYNWFRVDQ